MNFKNPVRDIGIGLLSERAALDRAIASAGCVQWQKSIPEEVNTDYAMRKK